MWITPFLLACSVTVLYVWYYVQLPLQQQSPTYVVVNTVETGNVDLSKPLNTVDTVMLSSQMTVALIGQENPGEQGIYRWISAQQPLERLMLFESNLVRFTCLSGRVFANAQLLYVAPNKIFSRLATESVSTVTADEPVTLNALNISGDLTVGQALNVQGLINGVDLQTDVYDPYDNVPSAWTNVTEAEGQQLLTLGSALTTANWNNLATMAQDVSTTSSPTFASLTSNNVFGFIPTSVTTYTSSDTFTWAASAKGLVVEVQAGGGGGGGSGTQDGERGGGGGGGSYVRLFFGVDDWGVDYTGLSFVIGTGGAGGATGNNSGSDGVNSTLSWVGSGDPLIATTFAGVGGRHPNSIMGQGGAGGAIPTIVGGYSNYTVLGSPGHNGHNSGNYQNPGGTNGGQSAFGRAGRGATEISNSVAGEFGAGGGGGCGDSGFDRAGAAGGDGFVRITTYV